MQIRALVTRVNELKGEMQSKTALATDTSDTGKRPRNGNTQITPSLDRTLVGNTSIEAWRIVKTSNLIVLDGKTYWFCLKHKDTQIPCRWNGRYVTHKPEEHDEVMLRRRNQRARQAAGTTRTNNNGSVKPGFNSGDDKMVISQKLKEVLLLLSLLL